MPNAVNVCYALLTVLAASGVATSVVTFSHVVSVLKTVGDASAAHQGTLLEGADPVEYKRLSALSYAHGMLLRRPEARKVCFVLTDGEGDPDATRAQCLSGAKLGVTTIGVGILEGVGHVYPNAVYVNNVADLGTVAFNKLKLAA
jgi:hypothetical protein